MKVGVFGGCFNPVHHGHLRLAVEALEILELDRVELVPAAIPPHKEQRGLLPYGLRCRLVQLAIRGVVDLHCSLIEGGRPGPSYTGDTLEELARAMPESQLFFLVGVPDLLTLPSWKNGLALTSKAHFVAVARQDMALETMRAFVRDHWPRSGEPYLRERDWRRVWEWPLEGGARSILLIHPPLVDVSSTMIRDYWNVGRDLRFLLPDSVLAELVRKRHLVDRYWASEEGGEVGEAVDINPGQPRGGCIHYR
ncbi:nicotinate (nicotinamide) nucleotide adenylyltransferase [Desulfonatronum sp. SC1]|uniref:nicotinate (nicotinamide) nucleotide adenylyltransferase n=1 Tax=Desulfonatronum sp. SC1 TaxID=2109626 RepID=UPI000D314920|nr:nicotinate (nicotinamide) nucleotide adenylyltransferase [Desulfonatronum sp. SC1]PTN35057.1 nicotinate (nicotinamide) nucleotide adenylyltransferase [Desulfonatronum sp. SC1]